jgi:outer membrane protein assembly factor BamA
MRITIYVILLLGLLAITQLSVAQEPDKSVKKAAVTLDTTKGKKIKKLSLTILPIPVYDRSKGAGLGAIGLLFIKSKNPLNPSSSIGGGGLYTTKKNWYFGLYEQFYLDDDNWRITSGQVLGNTNFQTYTIAPDLSQTEIPYENAVRLFYIQVKRQVFFDHFYTGLQYQASKSQTTFRPPDAPEEIETQNQYLIGVPFSYDSRNYIYSPSKGYSINLNINLLPSWLGNTDSYTKVTANINNYHSFNENMVLATRVSIFAALGTVPFVGEKVVGGTDIRGYSKGEYRGDQIYAAQAELRWHLVKRFGVVGFAGLAVSVDSTHKVSPLLPGVGVGVRYLLVKQERINIGADIAAGRDDYGIYFRISEAF